MSEQLSEYNKYNAVHKYTPLDANNPASALVPLAQPQTSVGLFGRPTARAPGTGMSASERLRRQGIPLSRGGGENDCMWTQVFMILVILWLLYQILPWILESCGMNNNEIEYRGRHRYNKNYYV